jgi:RND family efflux transporter MFP subunit
MANNSNFKHSLIPGIFRFLILSFILSCSPETEVQEYPADLGGKRQLLQEKQKAFSQLTKEIQQLQNEIKDLDPEAVDSRKLVTTRMMKPEDFVKYVDIQGAVKSADEINISSESGGRITSLLVDEGSYVKKGQLIAKLDLDILVKQKQEIEKAYELAKTVYDKRAALWEKNIGAEIQYLEAKNNKERLEKNLETINSQIAKANVYSPISGVVDRVLLESGELASPGMPIVQVINTSSVKVVADVPENYLPSIKRGDMVTVMIPALEKELRAKVVLIGRTINPVNRTFTVEVKLPNPTQLLKPNLLATMKIREFEEKNAMIVPLDIIQQEVSGADYVFIVNRKGDELVAEKVYVTIGESYDNNIVVRDGLKEGLELILEGALGLNEKDELLLAEPNAE